MKKVQERLGQAIDVLESDAVQEALGLIPNAPFPAGLLVKNLLNVLVVGVVSLSFFIVICVRHTDQSPVSRKYLR